LLTVEKNIYKPFDDQFPKDVIYPDIVIILGPNYKKKSYDNLMTYEYLKSNL